MVLDKMNILFVVESFPSYSEAFIVNQLYDLHLKGHHVFVYSIKRGKTGQVTNFQISALQKWVWYYELRSSRLGRLMDACLGILRMPLGLCLNSLRNPKKFFREPILLLDKKVDVVHCHYGPSAVFFHKNFFQKGFFAGAIKVCTFHGYDMEPAKREEYTKTYDGIFQDFDFVTYNSPFLGDIVRRCNEKIKAIEMPVGLNFQFLEKSYKPSEKNEKFTTVFCGRLIELKGVLLLPRIFALLKKEISNFECIVVGDGPLREKLSKDVSENNLEEHIKLTGSQNQDQLFETLNRAHVLILPGLVQSATGLAETQGLVIQEAQFFGLPVVVSDAGGMKYGMVHEETGFVVEQNDVVEFKNALVKLCGDKELYSRMSKKAREFVLANYDISKLNDGLILEYEKALNK